MSDCEISTDPARLQIARIHRFLSEKSYWCPGIAETLVRKAIANSLCFGVYTASDSSDGIQIGFARVVTDRTTFAYLCDVYIEVEYRGRGLSKRLMEEILMHPDLQGLRRFSLATRSAHSLYTRYGFKVIEKPENWLEIKASGPSPSTPT